MTDEQMRQAVRELLLSNVKEGYSSLLGRHYCYIAPSLKTYPFQWFWDSCFHAIILARLGEADAAKKNLRSLFEMQEDDGFVGHMIFWKQVLPKRYTDVIQARPSLRTLRPHMSALIQPPFAAQALAAVFEADGDRVFLGEMYAKVRRLHQWLAENRDFDGDGLLTIISPFESGMDWKPSYDAVLGYARRTTGRRLYTSSLFWRAVAVDCANFVVRYDLARIRQRARFLVKDAGFNAIYALDLGAMERLAAVIGDDASRFAARRRRVASSILERMYDEADAAFYDLREPGGEKLRIRTATIFFPLALEEVEDRIAGRVLETHFDRHERFASPLPLPSVALNDPAFYPGETPFIWRGPTWSFINWFLYHALMRRGEHRRAGRLRDALRALVGASGFREYYDPVSGQGHGARDFTWSGLLVDMS